ncbi:hypothetical protein [Leptothrix ochracea]|uniref:hypothetical protein n=1 Tax=Leptothrix ochracea TaxID=735331 RepID=UPI0034E232AC
MSEITLSDYTGYIFIEIIKAREMADAYAREVAQRYAQDEVLRHFSAPRFKIPKMNLTVPVLISGAKFSQIVRFNMEETAFRDYISKEIQLILRTIEFNTIKVLPIIDRPIKPVAPIITPIISPITPISPINPVKPFSPLTPLTPLLMAAPEGAMGASATDDAIGIFYKDLTGNALATQPEITIRDSWRLIFDTAIKEAGLSEVYQKQNPNNELFDQSVADIISTINTHTVIAKTQIESLLVDPETNVVKNGSSDSSVFTLQAELNEEGFFIKSVKDANTGMQSLIVEFD